MELKSCKNEFCPNSNPQKLDQFWKKKSYSDGLMPFCKTCTLYFRKLKKLKIKFMNGNFIQKQKILNDLSIDEKYEWFMSFYQKKISINTLSEWFQYKSEDIVLYFMKLDILDKSFRKCVKCKQWKNYDYFWIRNTTTGEPTSRCIDCRKENFTHLKNLQNERNELITQGLKKCTNKGCKQSIKSIDNFKTDNSKSDGYCNWCDDCRENYRINNKERIIQYSKQYLEKNKERKYYYFNNIYRPKNINRLKQKRKQWGLDNPEKIIGYHHNRKKIFENALPKWANRNAINQIYKLRDKLSKLTGQKYHVDHIIPLNNKNVCGLHVETNLQIIPAHDNLSKSNKFTVYVDDIVCST